MSLRGGSLTLPLSCKQASPGHVRGVECTSRNRPESIERSACPCCSSAYDVTPSPTPMETTPEQQLAAVWSLSSPTASTAPTLPRQGQPNRQRTPVAQQNKFRKGVGKGAGKAMSYAKRTRKQEEEEELWMDSELDEATIRRTLRTLVRAAARHEQQLTSLEADSYVLFLETGNHGMISMLIQASQAWRQQYEAGTVTTTLRATLWGVLLLEWQARLTRIGPPNSGGGQLDFADSAPVSVHRMECGAEESPAIKHGRPHSRAGQASRGQPAEEHGKGRHSASAPKPQATAPGSAGRRRGDAPDPDHPSTCGGSLSGPGPASQQLPGKGDRTSAAQRKGQQNVPGEGAGKTAALSRQRTPLHQSGSTNEKQREMRSPLPTSITGNGDTAQCSISSFFQGRGSVRSQAVTSSHQTHSDGCRHAKDNKEDTSVRNGASTQQGLPPADKVRDPACAVVTRGPRKNGSLLSWRAVDNKSSEPRAYALAFVNPHNICYANAVLHMLHQARSRAGLITGLGDLNGSLMQAARSNQAVNIARDPAWSFVWPGWFLQHLCQRTACAALQGGWEARRHGEGAYAVLDEQFTCPHIRLPMNRPFRIQEAI